MVVLDATIVNIALPSAQKALHFSTDSRQWIITAYALAFGSLLLLGGKLGDLFGRKWTFIAGLIGFSIASAIGGLATSFGMLVGSGVFGVFLFLTYYMQQNLGFSPLATGVAFLPMTGMIVVTATTVQTRVLDKTGPKPLIVLGMTFGIAAMVLFTRLTSGGSYATEVLPGLLVIGFGMGCIFAPAFGTATLGVDRQEAGIASAMVNTSQQVGGSVGTALLSTLFASSAASYAASHRVLPAVAMVHGYTTAFWWAAGIFAVGLLVAVLVLPGRIGPARPAVEAALATE